MTGGGLTYWRAGPAPASSPYTDCTIRAGVLGCPAIPHHHTDPVPHGFAAVPGQCGKCGAELVGGRCPNGSDIDR